MKGIVIKSTGSWYHIRTENGTHYQARIRGKFRIANIKHTNPIAVGDEVDFDVDSDNLAMITHIHERRNYIIRKSVNLSKKTHIIASNIDVAFLVATMTNPKTSFGFIDRFLITAEAYQIPVVILFNKMDSYGQDELDDLALYKHIYNSIGYESLDISAASGLNLDLVREMMKDRVSLVSGHSGVGKSTLINSLNPELNLKTLEISDFNSKGQHTTTFAQMYEWPFGGFIIDTPGIKEFGLVELEKHELQGYFPDILAFKDGCKFDNCIHVNEPKCAVLDALEKGQIAPSRYENYLTFLDEDIYLQDQKAFN